MKGKRLVLLGDHKQLPPTVISQEAEENGFSISLLERLADRYGDGALSMLTTQYRMNESIMKYPNEQFYNGQLVAGEINRQWHLNVATNDKWLNGCIQTGSGFIHVEGQEKKLGDSPSRMNVAEAEMARDVVKKTGSSGRRN